MRAVVQRVEQASVAVDGKVVGECGKGLVVLLAAHRLDTQSEAARMADRIWGMRIFNDSDGKLNLSLKDLSENESVGVLAISNFTIYGDASQRRPSFVESAGYEAGESLFGEFVAELKKLGCPVQSGIFGADLKVSLVNDGPVTIVVEVAAK